MLEFSEPPCVLNQRDKPKIGVYVGRPSKFGNPFEIGPDGSRDEVLRKYRKWIQTQPELIEAAKTELRGHNLICWCVPKTCHATILLHLANE